MKNFNIVNNIYIFGIVNIIYKGIIDAKSVLFLFDVRENWIVVNIIRTFRLEVFNVMDL